MKMLACFVTTDFKRRIDAEAKRDGMTTSDFMRDLLKERLGEDKDIGTQKQKC